jgi:3-(3-hydroxy-phenyl)propionate hydroxylase
MNDQHCAAGKPVIVGAGPVGCTAALLLADLGIPVTLLERHPEPHPLPRAVHLDDEVARTLHRIGVSEEFLARSRPASGLRLLDARHRVMAEFRREHQAGVHGFPQANMFHQPDLEELLLARVQEHPLISLRRGAEVFRLDDAAGPLAASPTRVHARMAEQPQVLTAPVVLGCDGANSTVRELAGIGMEDLGFTERWLVVDIRASADLDTWDGVEQVCDPARAATFMQVTGDRYRWEFQLHDGEDEASLITPRALGRLLRPWTGRGDLAGLEIIRSASYTFRARLASRFQAGRVFLLGDAAHLTPPFIGQGLAAGLRDADNLAWKLAHVLTGQAGEDLLASYDAERRPHAQAMVKKAVRVGWAMTGGQDGAAAVRRIALAAALRSDRIRQAMISTATPRLAAGALQHPPRRLLPSPAPLRPGGLIPNPLVSTGDGPPVRLDTVLAGRAAVLTARQPEAALTHFCGRHHLLLMRVSGPPGTRDQAPSGAGAQAGPAGIRLARHERSAALQALIDNPALSIIVRPDRVVAAVESGSRLPRLPWHVPPPQSRPQPVDTAPAAHPVRSPGHPSGGLHARGSVTAAGCILPPAGPGQADRPPACRSSPWATGRCGGWPGAGRFGGAGLPRQPCRSVRAGGGRLRAHQRGR